MPIIFSTTTPASSACQPPARIYFVAPDDALLARVTEKVAEQMGRHLSYTFHDEAPSGVTPIILEDVGPSALPVPSAAVALSDDLRDGLVAISKAVADQDDRAAQAMLKGILAAPQPSPTAQTDSAPAWASQAVIEYRYTGGTHWCPLGPAERMKPNFDGVYRLQGGVFPVEAPADSQPAPVLDYPPLPRVGAIGYASVADIESYAKTLTIGPHLPGVRDIALWTTDQMRAYVDADRAARTQADSVTAPAAYSGNLEQELAMLIRRIVSSARRNCEDGSNVLKLANEAWVYLVRKGLNNSPLRNAGIETDPTPPAPAADSVQEDAGGANWQDISTAPKDGTRFVAVGQNYGLDSEAQHTCIAQWFRGCWIEVSDWNGASKLKYLTHWMPLPPLPGSAARKQGGA